MGCCQTRERVTNPKKNEAFALTHYDEVIYTNDCLEFIDECESSKDWEEIIRYSVVNVPEVQERCFQVLNNNIREHRQDIFEVFVCFVPSILNSVKNTSDSQRKSSLKLIKLVAEHAEKIEEVAQQNIFNCALRFFICNDPELRMLAASTCHAIFNQKYESQKLFLNMNGISMFLHMILLSIDDQKALGILLDFFIDMILDSNGDLNPCVFKHTGNIEVYHVFRELWKQKVSEANGCRIYRLTGVLFDPNFMNRFKDQ